MILYFQVQFLGFVLLMGFKQLLISHKRTGCFVTARRGGMGSGMAGVEVQKGGDICVFVADS